jgi:hypothetical protein
MCPNGHTMRVKEGPHGAQAIRHFQTNCTSWV